MTRATMPGQVAPGLGGESTGQYLTFQLADDEYGVPLLSVREIIEYREITPVPMAPDWMLGVINLRGSIVPVVDLRVRLGLDRAKVTRRSCIVIVESQTNEELVVASILVDAVREVIGLTPDEIQDAPDLCKREMHTVRSIARRDEHLVLLMDCEDVLDFRDVDSSVLFDGSNVEAAGAVDGE